MEGNKDEALKCLRIGKQALEGGDKARALKFVLKARRLDPSLPVDELLERIEGDQVEREAAPSAEAASAAGQSTVRQRVGVNGSVAGAGAGASSSSTKDYTEEQLLVVRQIRKKKDYYEILGVERGCTVEDVRKAYRKLSLKVHPDKNKAPGSEEAFKLVSKAFQCLSDEESKRKYDVSGSDEPVYERRPTRHAAQGFNGFYDGEVDAEEIFRNFFFGGMGVTQQTQFRGFQFGTGMGHRMPANGSPGGSGFRTLIQLLPVILILLLNFLPSNDPIYSLRQSYPYEQKFATQKGVPFYVKSPDFEQQYPPSSPKRVSLESKIERDFFNIVGQNCRAEMQRVHWGLANKAPHCDILQQFEDVA
uniref:J domain-containing protein n=1 Tax=Kalanchoe fedtschenkoi TaxID=63787 RepID=A0A7N0TDQ1_KALFE